MGITQVLFSDSHPDADPNIRIKKRVTRLEKTVAKLKKKLSRHRDTYGAQLADVESRVKRLRGIGYFAYSLREDVQHFANFVLAQADWPAQWENKHDDFPPVNPAWVPPSVWQQRLSGSMTKQGVQSWKARMEKQWAQHFDRWSEGQEQ
jgi:hypothetical protein